MTDRRFRALTIGLFFLAGAGVSAHHNMSALFDFDQRFTRTGVLTRADWMNPHIYLAVDVKNDEGKTESWSFEGPAPNFFRTRKISKADFEQAIGKSVTVDASRARDGSLKGLIRVVTLPGGREISLCPQNC